MKYLAVLAVLLLSSCHKKEPVALPETTEPETAVATGDTVTKTYDSRVNADNYNDRLHRTDTLLHIGGNQYTFSTLAQSLMDKEYSYTATYTEKGVNHKSFHLGYDARYGFILKDASGKELFNKTLTKKDLEKVADGTIVAEAFIEPPYFMEYIPSFDGFLVGLSVMLPDSDVGEQLLLLFDRKGKITRMFSDNFYGGGGTDGAVEVAPNGSFIAANNVILHKNGKDVPLNTNNNVLIAAKRVINNNILLVIDATEKENNARLINPQGKVLKTFSYHGYYDMLGYTLPIHEDASGLYLIDNPEALRVIPRKNPLATRLLKFDAIPTYNGTKVRGEVEFSIRNEAPDVIYIFAHDTAAGTFRRHIIK